MTEFLDALGSPDPLIVYVDIKSPYAFVAIQPTLTMAQELKIDIDWRPLTLDIPSYLGSAKKSQGKVVQSNRSPRQWHAVRYAYRDARRYAERQGYVLKGTEKIWDSSLANIAILWVMQHNRKRIGDYFAAVYPPFWRRELDIEDIHFVGKCIQAAGINDEGFASFALNEGRLIHDQLQAQLHPAGIYGVPTYVLHNEILFGREHLPYIAWQLQGQNGPAPDIAYTL